MRGHHLLVCVRVCERERDSDQSRWMRYTEDFFRPLQSNSCSLWCLLCLLKTLFFESSASPAPGESVPRTQSSVSAVMHTSPVIRYLGYWETSVSSYSCEKSDKRSYPHISLCLQMCSNAVFYKGLERDFFLPYGRLFSFSSSSSFWCFSLFLSLFFLS